MLSSRLVPVVIALLAVLVLAGPASAKLKFYGNVEKMPATGSLGEWVVDGKTVQVLEDSKIDMDKGRPEIGAFVKVKGLKYDNKILVYEIEVKKGNFNPPAKK
ncbi:MAG: hypothetical protein FJ134_01150 [Deltaproteobacteria bacterium]|nr:hypothetical protein [Deltaproteobacteria bacterium]